MFEIAKGLFRYERLGTTGYACSLNFNPSRYFPYVPVDIPTTQYDDENAAGVLGIHFKEIDTLGPYERYLLLRLLRREHTLYAVVGARGCGKTVTMKHLAQFVKDNYIGSGPSPLVGYIDGNSMLPPEGDTPDRKRAYIHDQLGQRLLETVLKYRSDLRQVIMERLDKSSIPSNTYFLRLLLEVRKKLVQEVLDDFGFVEIINNQYDRLEILNRVSFCITALGLIWNDNTDRFVFLCIDNLDPFELSIQLELASWINSLVNEFQLPSIVALRMITYSRYDIRHLVMGVVAHGGISPLQEISRRVDCVVSGKKAVAAFAESTPRAKASFLLRTAELVQAFGQDVALKNIFRSIAGRSVHRGLVTMIRLYSSDEYIRSFRGIKDEEIRRVLSIFEESHKRATDICLRELYQCALDLYGRYAQRAPKTYHYVQLLIRSGLADSDGNGVLIENVFREGSSPSISTLKYRMLRRLWTAMEHEKHALDVGVLLGYVTEMGYSYEGICEAFNSLHQPGRRLIWCSGVNYYPDFQALQHDWQEKVGLSSSGICYLNYMCTNLDYLAAMFARTEQDRRNLLDHVVERRISFAAQLFYESLKGELEWYRQAKIGKKWLNPDKVHDRSETFVLIDVLVPVLISCQQILGDHARKIVNDGNQERFGDLQRRVQRLRELHDGYIAGLSTLGLGIEDHDGLRRLRWRLPG